MDRNPMDPSMLRERTMCQENLFKLASQNALHIETLYLACMARVAEKNRDHLERFSDFIRRMGRISINFKSQEFFGFLTTGKHLNAYEESEAKAKQSGLTAEEELQKKLVKYHVKRKGLNAAFADESLFHYGALNVGGTGLAYYGEYCAVLKPEFPGVQQDVVYVKLDSLDGYVDLTGHVDTKKLGQDLASDSHKCRLATVKHEDAIPQRQEKDWPSLLCSGRVYMEAIFLQPPAMDSLGCVRMSEIDMREFDELAFRSLTLVGLADDEKQRAGRHEQILTLLKNHNIPLEIL